MKKGFTLIELLVVVLIIGILSAIALPQYQKAVEKSKAAQALVLLRSVREAFERYKLANDVYPTKFSDLDIAIPWTGTDKLITSNVSDTLSNEEWSLQILKPTSSQDLIIGRRSGPYIGAAFRYGIIPLDEKMECVELASFSGAPAASRFTKAKGSYCQGVMHAQWREKSSGVDHFDMTF